ERMASIRACPLSGQVIVQAGVHGSGNVRRDVLVTAPLLILEIEAAVHDNPVIQMPSEQI
ncbi:MAG TPA: hypothetical protein VM846_12675, partial [Vicinamibacterales bacterium]|nr:hypothetical protein [Vicinamibacterales bacterium]